MLTKVKLYCSKKLFQAFFNIFFSPGFTLCTFQWKLSVRWGFEPQQCDPLPDRFYRKSSWEYDRIDTAHAIAGATLHVGILFAELLIKRLRTTAINAPLCTKANKEKRIVGNRLLNIFTIDFMNHGLISIKETRQSYRSFKRENAKKCQKQISGNVRAGALALPLSV